MHELRHQFVSLYLTGQYPKVALCHLFGVSRPTGDKWLARYTPDDLTTLQDQARAPRQHPNVTPARLAAVVTAVRQAHPRWGARKIRGYLVDTQPTEAWPAPSTITRLLHAAALIETPARRARAVAWPTPTLTEPTAPNVVWAADFKGWFRLGNGQRCDPFTVTDSYSRVLLACHACPQPTGAYVRTVCTQLFATYGLPTVIRTDNGPPFASCGLGGLSALNVWWMQLGIRPERIQPGRPQQNGRHERVHATLGLHTRPAADLAAQQQVFDAFRTEYNQLRPHEALGQTPPARHYQPSPRPYPTSLPPVEYPIAFHTRHVRPDGAIKWHGAHPFVSEALAGEWVGLWPLDDRLTVLYFATIPLAIWDEQAQHWLRRRDAQPYLAQLTGGVAPTSETGAVPPAPPTTPA